MYYTETEPMRKDGGMRQQQRGRAGMMRKGYMETKEMHKGTTPQDKSQYAQSGRISERTVRGFDRATGRYDTRAANGKDKDYHTCLRCKRQRLGRITLAFLIRTLKIK